MSKLIGRIKQVMWQNVQGRYFLKQVLQVHEALTEFVDWNNETFISLGENCSTAWYLKQAGLKQASYPFDWIFSSPDIVKDCIEDRFKKYLDKQYILPLGDGRSAGHQVYHQYMFNHKNPLKDYTYYQRCCTRFMDILSTSKPIVFVITLINEPEKRVLWSEGFKNHFPLPEKEGLARVKCLIEYLRGLHAQSKFIIIDHYTNQKRKIKFRQVETDIFALTFCAGGDSTGVLYTNALDDKAFKMVLLGSRIVNIQDTIVKS